MTDGACHVLVDGRSFTDASAFRGIGSYVREVVDGLARRPDMRVSALVTRAADVPDGITPVHVRRVAPGRFQTREHELLLPWDLRRVPSDVVLSPAMDPPSRCRPPWVQTIHDIVPLLGGGDPTGVERFRRIAGRFSAAAAVITVSRWTADEVLRHLDVEPSRVHVIPHGVHARYQPADGPDTEAPYVLFVGEYDPRKRHDLAYAAVGALADRGHPHTLKVTGRIAPWFADRMAQLRVDAPHPQRVELLGHVSQDELVRLYQRATALLVTSEAEGFGFPAAEAMACGTPVVAFANSATTEVVAGGGVLVEDGDVAALVEALVQVVESPTRRAELSGAALSRAALYTWERSVDLHAEVLRHAAR